MQMRGLHSYFMGLLALAAMSLFVAFLGGAEGVSPNQPGASTGVPKGKHTNAVPGPTNMHIRPETFYLGTNRVKLDVSKATISVNPKDRQDILDLVGRLTVRDSRVLDLSYRP